MSKKTRYDLGNNSSMSVYNRLIKEVDAAEIPAKYIDKIIVQYYDGNIVEMYGDDIHQPFPVNHQAVWDEMADSFIKMKNVNILIDIEKLEEDVDELVEKLLGKYC